MALDQKRRRELVAAGHALRATISVSAEGVSEGLVAHVREALAHHELVKVRVQTEDRADCDRIAAELARALGCELVQRVGRVALLHRAD
ncbi:MAG: YhbY family RNA-binding protein [Phycisphaerae bacterium]|nr:YhbY family RNA-binding protein [Phycisphaerae bacterium]MCZ2399724.1 YhbY family RNA-binding protein [Phycisphaerae bacterium]NUQ50332.1 YhbY family RNA-binding protein [Phycisphaerae bacterium]